MAEPGAPSLPETMSWAIVAGRKSAGGTRPVRFAGTASRGSNGPVAELACSEAPVTRPRLYWLCLSDSQRALDYCLLSIMLQNILRNAKSSLIHYISHS